MVLFCQPYTLCANRTYSDMITFVSGDVFIAKKADKQKKRKTKKVEDKMLGWGNCNRYLFYNYLQ